MKTLLTSLLSLGALSFWETAGAAISNDAEGQQQQHVIHVEPQTKRSTFEPFVPGDLAVHDDASGLLLSRGLSVRQLAQAGMPVAYTSSESSSSFSNLTFHTQPDGAAVFPLDGGGWVYLSNDEQEKFGRGGVYAVVFDADGEVLGYEQRLGKTTRNCGGGRTPHSTFISCEEYDRGRCHQIDPTGRRKPRVTKLTEAEGGSFESVAVDDRNASSPVYFVTEDNLLGALRRYRPHPSVAEGGWDSLHSDGGTLDYLEFFPNHTFTWTSDIAKGRRSAYYNYPNTEGIDFANGRLYFVSKLYKTLYILNLAKNTYDIEFTNEGALLNDTGFANSPDHVVARGDLVFMTEDGGLTPGLFARNVTSGECYTILEAYDEDVYNDDEACGLAFSPDRRRLYLAFQEAGKLFEITRDDGKPFYGRELLLKSHRVKG